MAGGSCPVIPCKDKAFLKDAAIMEVEETNTEEYKRIVKSDIGSIIYSKSGTEIPVQLSSGKYVLKYIHPASGKIETINKLLENQNVYIKKYQIRKKVFIGSIIIEQRIPLNDLQRDFLLFAGNI